MGNVILIGPDGAGKRALDDLKDEQIENLRAFKKEWIERFGFMAENNPPDSIEAIDEVATLLNAKSAEHNRATVSAEQIVDCLLAEYEYWKEFDSALSIGAIGAISNVIAFATVKDHRAEWHPKKVKSYGREVCKGEKL